MLGHQAISEAPLSSTTSIAGLSQTVTEALALADALAIRTGKVMTESAALTDEVSMIVASGWTPVTPPAASWAAVAGASSAWTPIVPTSTGWS